MTVKLKVSEIYTIIKLYATGSAEGWVPTQSVYNNVASIYSCSPNTIRNFVVRRPEFFEVEFGMIRPAKFSDKPSIEQLNDEEEFKSWIAPRIDLIGEVLFFLTNVPMSPSVENLLVAVANAREELRSYNDDKLRSLVIELCTIYSFVPKTQI